MPLSEDAFPYFDKDTQTNKVWDQGQAYDVDENGFALMPEGPENPFWNERAKFKPQPTTGPVTNYGTTPGYNPQTGQYGSQPPANIPPAGTTQPQGQGTLPPVNVQPGLSSQQWEATYNLSLAQEKRLRELMETVEQPKARALIDQAIQEIAMNRYGAQVQARQQQAKEVGFMPRWTPQIPQFEQGAWKGYQPGGLVAPPGGQAGVGGAPPAAMTDDQAAEAIWNSRPDIQSMYRAEHPDWPGVQAVKDWWRFAPHEGAGTLVDYARLKGYLMA